MAIQIEDLSPLVVKGLDAFRAYLRNLQPSNGSLIWPSDGGQVHLGGRSGVRVNLFWVAFGFAVAEGARVDDALAGATFAADHYYWCKQDSQGTKFVG